MDTKLHKFCTRYAKAYTESSRSTYYTFSGGIVLRVSDHYAKNSSGLVSIITSVDNPNQYVIIAKVTGKLRICTYEQVKNFVKGISQIAGFLPCTELSNPTTTTAVSLDTSWLSTAQFGQVRSWYKQKFGEELKLVVK